MGLKGKFRFVLPIAVLLVFSMLGLKNGCFAFEQEFGFEIIEKGDFSGYCEEAYFVVETEAEWMEVWERHSFIREPRESPPAIDFSENFVVCAFMGRRPTTGYSIDIERVWADDVVFVEVVKRGPAEGFVVCQVITCPYVMVLVEKTEMHFVFRVIDEFGRAVEYVLDEFPSAAISVIILMVLFAMGLLRFKIKNLVNERFSLHHF